MRKFSYMCDRLRCDKENKIKKNRGKGAKSTYSQDNSDGWAKGRD